MEFLIAALTIGFVGSLHCIGMCGPIALALPVYGQGVFNRIAGPLLYNTGRIITYGFLGMLFGLLGKGFVIGGYQQLLSIILGILILASMLLPASIKSRLGMTKIIAPFIAKIKSLLGRFLKQRTAGSFLIIGLLNGLLPCGLVYLAIAGAIATGDVINSGAFMMAFGIGTIPALLFVSIAAGSISLNMRSKITKAIPVFTIVMACLLILRGLDLGIPYLSPKLSKTDCTKHSCCAKK